MKDATKAGYVKCVTCGAILVAKGKGECEAGHFRHGKDRSCYFDEDNVHPQCTSCNHFHKDMAGKRYVLFMIEQYGEIRTEELLNSPTILWKRQDLEDKHTYYKEKVREVLDD